MAIVCDNDPAFVLAYLAILGAGMVAVPLNPQSPARELTRELGGGRVPCRHRRHGGRKGIRRRGRPRSTT